LSAIWRDLEDRSEASNGEVSDTRDGSSGVIPSAQSEVLDVEAWWDDDLEDPWLRRQLEGVL